MIIGELVDEVESEMMEKKIKWVKDQIKGKLSKIERLEGEIDRKCEELGRLQEEFEEFVNQDLEDVEVPSGSVVSGLLYVNGIELTHNTSWTSIGCDCQATTCNHSH
jgi:hypothetical protein